MDFRTAPAPTDLVWQGPRGAGKTKTCPATFQGKKFVIQTPLCKTRMFKDPRSTTLYLSLIDDLQQKFGEFIDVYEKHAAQHQTVELSSCLRNGSFRVTAWDDVQWFDDKGTYLKDTPTSVDSVVCVMEFGGVWVTETKWGLKWSVKQLMTKSAPAYPTPTSDPKPQYAFLD